MQTAQKFESDWFSPPGETIRQLINERGMTIRDFSEQVCFTEHFAEELIVGNVELTRDVAQELTNIFGGSQKFWLIREKEYREDLERFKQRELENWAMSFPYRDMARMGWVEAARKIEDKIRNILSFFGVSSLEEWQDSYKDRIALTAFRKSQTVESNSLSVAAWLRQGELLSQEIVCDEWNAEEFSKALTQARELTRIDDPEIFVPRLRELFAKCGVALVILKTPAGCRVSGAILPKNDQAVILLSFRYLSDDHFWFTVFHEAGHLLLHGSSRLFIEGNGSIGEAEENDANTFASNLLIPQEFRTEMEQLTARDWRQIARFARKIGVSAGIVVGQLQHAGILSHASLNNFKTRYKWSE